MNTIELAIKDNVLKHLFITAIGYLVLSVVVTAITSDFLNLMLGFNIVLAFLPVVFSIMFISKVKDGCNQKQDYIYLGSIFILWLCFFPNSFYLITDFIHLGGEEFYYRENLYSDLIYTNNFMGYLTLIHIFIGAFIAVIMASYSLKTIHTYFIAKFDHNIAILLIGIILLLSSIGIYIGRFLRFNTWNLFKPITLLKDFAQSLSFFSFQFILIFFLVQTVLYIFIYPFISDGKSSCNEVIYEKIT